ncbi:MAG: M42 family metallopeptidase [Oscillospiraceae bacterium]|jgi:endoglucanase|nr:M42 family metallopeptidase [Oscillospiraceae bacterium]
MLNIFEAIKRMNAVCSPSGSEADIADIIRGLCAGYADEISADAMGNLTALKKGTGRGKRIMLSAHMDSVGFIVTHIDEKGFIRFSNLGGLTPALLLGVPVKFKNGTRGVIFKDGKPEIKDLKLHELYIDIGAGSKEEAEKQVAVADSAVYAAETYMVTGDVIVSPYLDDRLGCAVLIDVLMCMREPVNDVYFVFSAQEELGLRGARTAAFGIDPEIGIAVDVTRTGDTPNPAGVMETYLGKGAAIKVMDSSLICSPEIVSGLEECARSNGIEYQLEVLVAGGTDAGAMQLTRGGVHAGAVSIPTRYIHSPSEMASLRDAEAAARLIREYVSREIEL